MLSSTRWPLNPSKSAWHGLEGAFQQINERLGSLEQRLSAEIAAVRAEVLDLRRQMTTQFYWILTFVLGSILIPILRDTIR